MLSSHFPEGNEMLIFREIPRWCFDSLKHYIKSPPTTGTPNQWSNFKATFHASLWHDSIRFLNIFNSFHLDFLVTLSLEADFCFFPFGRSPLANDKVVTKIVI